MSDLVTFLRDRLDEDEATARRAKPAPWTSDGGVYGTHPTDEIVDYVYGDSADHIARHDPGRVLRDVEAKRRIVDEYAEAVEHAMDPAAPEMMAMWVGTALDVVVRLLAGVYADHPDYDPAWAPGAS